MKNRLILYVLVILLSSVFVHFLFSGHPNKTVFDEVHFGKFISGYFTHEYFFDIHPPLGKLMISGAGYLAGFKSSFSFAEIGQKFPDNTYLWLRLLPTLAGVLLPLVIFFLILRLGLSRLAAFAAAMLIVFENGLLVQSRFILLDSFLLLFGFSALLSYFSYIRGKNINQHIPLSRNCNIMGYTGENGQMRYLLLAGVFGALSMSVKWTGATFLALIIILEIVKIVREKSWSRPLKDLITLVALPSLIYFSIFAAHLGLLTKSGPGDAFMTPAFQKTLTGSNYQNSFDIKPLNIFEKFKELNIEMYRANANLTAGHPYSSKWYTWPSMTRPIYYWHEGPSVSVPTKESRIYFLGNPVIWWASTIAIIYLLISLSRSIFGLAMSKIRRLYDLVTHQMSNEASRKIKPLPALLAGAYLLNLLPFIGITRAMFLYHYIVGLIFAIIALIYLIDKLQNKKKVFGALLIVSFLTFLFFSPLTYGLPLSDPAYNLRVWLPTWR